MGYPANVVAVAAADRRRVRHSEADRRVTVRRLILLIVVAGIAVVVVKAGIDSLCRGRDDG